MAVTVIFGRAVSSCALVAVDKTEPIAWPTAVSDTINARMEARWMGFNLMRTLENGVWYRTLKPTSNPSKQMKLKLPSGRLHTARVLTASGRSSSTR